MSGEVKVLLRAGLVGAGSVSVLALMAGLLAGSWLAMAAVLVVVAVVAAVAGMLARGPLVVRRASETAAARPVETVAAPPAETDQWHR